jgi:hypothetical protein
MEFGRQAFDCGFKCGVRMASGEQFNQMLA